MTARHAATQTASRRRSAGILLYRRGPGLQVLLGHMGGPFWQRKDAGAWTIPKGEHPPDEEAFAAARREFTEELGTPPPANGYLDLGELVASGKRLQIWATAGDFDPDVLISNTFELQWPPRSGRTQAFPELDRVAWWDLPQAGEKIVKGQRPYLDRLVAALTSD